MASTQPSPVPNQPQPDFTVLAQPNHYSLQGHGISVTYLPTGAGGVAHLSYQDPHRSMTFAGDQIRKDAVSDLGTFVSVTLSLTVDSGSTTFSVLIPFVNLQSHTGASLAIHTDGITTTHRLSLAPMLNLGQRESYVVTPLSGTASVGIIPL